ncbi:tripartite tricarboxylate transporter TctB family protein [Petrocella sp. FN5]|uniref:tripartite tricarboxylate transporter TctB family protein n=1 Tax=Petrocella sp. FN5 TaxID=3032002 RepID=UPI0023DA817A|nr:tripartite tricarboxylate transporter TctB family protein [Petrocella sp. FN5]MDF1616753.1 tripartite tricarboxylate transporter TctB family protein [Petrocella sp. FN5]
MSDLFRIKIVYSQSHTIGPKIIFGILIIFSIILLIQAIMKAKKENRPLLSLKHKHFFIENYDRVKLLGTGILLILYIMTMNLLGFIPAGILFISLFNVLYKGSREIKSILISIGIATIETMLIWFIFGYMFGVTLP